MALKNAKTLAGFLKEIDKYDRATLLFPLTYDKDGKDNYNTEAQLAELDRRYGWSPIRKGCYKVKLQKDTFAYKNSERCQLSDLLGLMIVIEVEPQSYDYKGTKGWYLKLLSAKTI